MPKWAIGYQVAAASITTDTMLFADNAVGDQTSYESDVSFTSTPARLTGLYTLTPTYPTVARLRFTFYVAGNASYNAEYWDGSAWQPAPWTSAPSTPSSGWATVNQTITPTAAQYWRLSVRDNLAMGTARIADFRLFDGSNNQIDDTGGGGGGGGGGSVSPRMVAVAVEETFGAVIVPGLAAAAREETFGAIPL